MTREDDMTKVLVNSKQKACVDKLKYYKKTIQCAVNLASFDADIAKILALTPKAFKELSKKEFADYTFCNPNTSKLVGRFCKESNLRMVQRSNLVKAPFVMTRVCGRCHMPHTKQKIFEDAKYRLYSVCQTLGERLNVKLDNFKGHKDIEYETIFEIEEAQQKPITEIQLTVSTLKCGRCDKAHSNLNVAYDAQHKPYAFCPIQGERLNVKLNTTKPKTLTLADLKYQLFETLFVAKNASPEEIQRINGAWQ